MPEPLQADTFYHIYNRANGNDSLFLSIENYRYFLQSFNRHIGSIQQTFAYCLMPNHFHFLVRFKTEEELTVLSEQKNYPTNEFFLSKQFSNLFSSYTQAFNKQNDRRGSLFMRPFKRKSVANEDYLRKLIHYIHRNPVEAGLTIKPGDWKYSSYNQILATYDTIVERQEVLGLFGDRENFSHVHRQSPGVFNHQLFS